MATKQLDSDADLWAAALAAKAGHPLALGRLVSAALETRTYLVGSALSDTDTRVAAALAGCAEAAALPRVGRWLALLSVAPAAASGGGGGGGGGAPAAPAAKKERKPDLEKQAAAIAAKKAAQAAAVAAAGGGAEGEAKVKSKATGNAGGGGDSGSLPELEGAVMGEVVTRFPPEPSGYLHIGHVKAVLLNEFYARHYKGRLIVRFDDTNPDKEKGEFEENIVADLAALGVKGDIVTHSSDYFPLCADYARTMIREGKAFMDDTPQERMREERGNLVDSAHRGAAVADNLARFELMLAGEETGKAWCLRAKINMQSPNGTMRDPVLYRANDTPHHRTGTTYKAYPTYDFVCPIVDSIEGVTHALRTSEYADREEQYVWLQAAMGLRRVHIHEFSRLNFVFTLLSKRKLAWFADTGKVDGWYDPRFPTVQGIIRRGVTVPALREFILGQGASKRVLDMEWDKFWAINKKHIDPVAGRFTVVVAAGRVPLTLVGGDGLPAEAEVRAVPLHPKNADMGTKAVWFGPRLLLEADDAAALVDGEEITLMKWGNVVVKRISRGASGAVEGVEAELHLAGDFKKTEKKLTWVADVGAAAGAPLVPLRLEEFDFLITKPKLEEGDDFEAVVNPHTKWETAALGEPAMRTLQRGDIIQLERKGFFRVDAPLLDDARPMVLFAVPDTKPKKGGVIERWAAAEAAKAPPAGGGGGAAPAKKAPKEAPKTNCSS